ncbi:MAG: hypothetical protein HYY16_11115 [Planctomycetes bacterium]|nr:hypothetical protein [Planctomycetota bacterium]
MRSTFNSGSLLLAALLLGGCGESSPAAPPPTTPPAIAEARKLLKEAGFPDGRDFPELEVLYNDAEWHKRIAAAIQEMWRQNLGIRVKLRAEEWRVFLASRNEGRFQIARGGFLGEYRDPQAFLRLFTSDSGFNSTKWTDAEYDALLKTADEELDPQKRYAVLAKAERRLLDQAPAVPIFHYVGHNWVKPFVKGVVPNYRDMHPMQHVWLEGEGTPKDGVLRYYAGEEASSVDPALAHDIRGLKTALCLFEGLVGYDPKDASPVPALAEHWSISQDGLTYTFHLRDAVWSNGDPVTAGDFVWSWRRAADPKTPSSYKDLFYPLRNGRTIVKGEKPVEELGVRAPDRRTVVVELERPTPYFLSILCLNVFCPVHRATVEKHGKDWTRPENMVNNGPYRLVEWRINDRQVFEANPRWRAADQVRLKKFVWLTGSDIAAGFRQYENDECHWIYQAPIERMDELARRSDHVSGPYNASYFYAFNVTVKPLDDPRVRRALSLAIDREKIVKYILRGGESPAVRLTPPLYPGYEAPR